MASLVRRATAAMLSGGDAWRCRARRLIGPRCVSWHPFSAAGCVDDADWAAPGAVSWWAGIGRWMRLRPRCHANAMHNALPTHLAAGHWQPQETRRAPPSCAFLGPFLGLGLSHFHGAASGAASPVSHGCTPCIMYVCCRGRGRGSASRRRPAGSVRQQACQVRENREAWVDSLVLHLPPASILCIRYSACCTLPALFRCLRRTGTYAVLPD